MATKAYVEESVTEAICDNLFESIDDLLDFSYDDGELAVEDACENEAPLAPSASPAKISAGNCSPGVHVSCDGASFHSRPQDDDLGLQCNDMDITNLEWLSNFFEENEFNFDFPAAIKNDSLFGSLSPISVLRSGAAITAASSGGGGGGGGACSPTSSSSYSSGSCILIVPARARTKRSRPLSSSRSFVPPPAESEIVGHSFAPVRKMKIKRKKKEAAAPDDSEENTTVAATVVRKCAHCEIQKTPQWRAGPMGPKTLCNACGVRYKSGRLFPEYRPAASPTFVPALHSNSHKKVVEMRLRASDAATDGSGERAVAAKNCELIEYIRRGERDREMDDSFGK